MAMGLPARAAFAAACVALAAASSMARADELPLVTGKQWTESSDQVKKAYLIGIANVIQVERAYHAGNAPPDAQSVLPRMAKGLQDQTLDSVREGLDRWYASHRDQLQRPVIETLWFEMALPGLQKAR
ncbi:hypothetical protein GCM10028796_28940 [Ramlibacter monticola]|uniref:Uncharacterized protein n=1 Tax=Ramlibacter monticola TaxID=1926872 RepID=A0A936YY02_9BURK|nr:hypothetical protein [Ramlibacter monticola]MBL0390687.1 hypothetical protein [Ramlibacter monticola]